MSPLFDRAYNFAFESRLGIKTRGRRSVDVADGAAYSTENYRNVRRVLRVVELKSDDVLVDLGCGMGRVVCCAATLKIKKVIGLEIDPDLAKVARGNASAMRGRRSAVEIVEGSASEYTFPDATAIYMFNPFGAETLNLVLQNILAACRARACEIRVAYVFPIHDRLFEAVGGAELVQRLDGGKESGLSHSVSIWRLGADL